jgi:hypothetical protein
MTIELDSESDISLPSLSTTVKFDCAEVSILSPIKTGIARTAAIDRPPRSMLTLPSSFVTEPALLCAVALSGRKLRSNTTSKIGDRSTVKTRPRRMVNHRPEPC